LESRKRFGNVFGKVSTQAEEGKNGENDDHGADQPDNVIHFSISIFMIVPG
jgi:hypothetical protein